MAAYVNSLIVSAMKKFLFLFIVFLLAVEFRNHPSLKPYTDKVISLITNKAKRTAGIDDFPLLLNDMKQLSSLIANHEYDFIRHEITSFEKASAFYNRQCGNVGLSHTVLTGYAIKKTCGIIEKYVSTTD